MRHSNRYLNLLIVVSSILFMGLSFLAPVYADELALWVVLASVFAIGIPHGAIDHVMAAELYNLNQTLKDHLLFYASYLLVMIVVGALWIVLPVGGMVFFLAISIYHFGQADMEDFTTSACPAKRLLYLNRGLLIIGLIVFSDHTVTYPIMADAMQLSADQFSAFMPPPAASILLITGIYLMLSLLAIAAGWVHRPLIYLSDSTLLASLLYVTGPLIGFAIYFALWHSAGHINEMRHFFKSRGASLSVAEFYMKALPFTLVSLAGLGLLAGINIFLDMENQFLTLMFILISVLTLPHMLIVERMYNEKRV
ncbi:MAG: beta-carotene 15,15'-dioxygenase, Brp/Blh family [Bacteroidetes bacterium]|nr:beta-carotene 15,15'-dioxygenase, Brp/Blh family [Bacteroidota bacterium]